MQKEQPRNLMVEHNSAVFAHESMGQKHLLTLALCFCSLGCPTPPGLSSGCSQLRDDLLVWFVYKKFGTDLLPLLSMCPLFLGITSEEQGMQARKSKTSNLSKPKVGTCTRLFLLKSNGQDRFQARQHSEEGQPTVPVGA